MDGAIYTMNLVLKLWDMNEVLKLKSILMCQVYLLFKNLFFFLLKASLKTSFFSFFLLTSH